jgi:Amt family ammonium transporter
MKRLIAFLMLSATLALGGTALAQDKGAADKAAADKAAPAAAAPAAAPAAAAPAAAAPAGAPAAAPAAAPAPTPNKGDVAWMLVSTALVLMMSVPALALFYGGMVRSKNMLSMLMQVFVVFSLVTVLWCVYGYRSRSRRGTSSSEASPSACSSRERSIP